MGRACSCLALIPVTLEMTIAMRIGENLLQKLYFCWPSIPFRTGTACLAIGATAASKILMRKECRYRLAQANRW
eukprot:6187991-Pleurochrysis_carterae.AAC.1